MRGRIAGLVLFVGAVAAPLPADVWDVGSLNDNGHTTINRLSHGSSQAHDLEALHLAGVNVPDEDWYRVQQAEFSSQEFVVEALAPELLPDPSGNTGLLLQLVDSAGAVLDQSESADFSGNDKTPIRSLVLENTEAQEKSRLLRVKSAGCTSTCTATADYRIRARDTTYAFPRFNNTATQVTFVVLQNPLPRTVQGTLWFRKDGVLRNATVVTIPAFGEQVINTSSLPDLAVGGSLTFSNDAPYGALAGKAISLEAATGFTFDTLMVPRGD